MNSEVKEKDIEVLEKLLSPVTKNSAETAQKLILKFSCLANVCCADVDRLAEALSGDRKIANYIRLSVALTARAVTDSYKFPKVYTREQIGEYLKGLFFGMDKETLYLISIDKAGRLTHVDVGGEGSVNISNILPRKLIETALKRGASSVIIAHNHPLGVSAPSEEDIMATISLKQLFASSQIDLVSHYIVGLDGYYIFDKFD